jgi:hypothetical protein
MEAENLTLELRLGDRFCLTLLLVDERVADELTSIHSMIALNVVDCSNCTHVLKEPRNDWRHIVVIMQVPMDGILISARKTLTPYNCLSVLHGTRVTPRCCKHY